LKIPVVLITGFLGSGKTTFLNQILIQHDQQLKIGIIQNEFAPANVDGTELKSKGRTFEILEINNGSIFCVCLLSNFVDALVSFVNKKKPDLILIEASGLSDPVSLVEIMQNPMLADLIYLEKIWCILDALHYSKVGKMMGRQKHQILIADEILINKTDLVNRDHIGQIREYIRNINPTAGITETLFCRGDFSVMEKADRNPPQAYIHQEKLLGAESGRPDIKAGVFKSGRRIRFHDLQQLIRETVPSTMRIKGYVSLTNGETALVHAVFQSIQIQHTNDIYGSTCLVFMGENFNLSTFSRTFRDLTLKNEH